MPIDDDDCLNAILTTGDQEIPAELMQKVREAIATVEPITGVNVRDHLQFGKKGNATIKYFKVEGQHLIGEHNDKN